MSKKSLPVDLTLADLEEILSWWAFVESEGRMQDEETEAAFKKITEAIDRIKRAA